MREHPALEGYLGRKVILGVRPEHLEDAALVPGTSPGSVIDVRVELREELGSEVDVHCRVGVTALHPEVPGEPAAGPETADPDVDVVAGLAQTIVARMDPRTTLTENQSAKVHVDLAAVHFFDPETGESLRG